MQISLDPALYPRAAIEQAVGAFAHLSSMSLDLDTHVVTIEPNGDPSLVDEFLNFALMAALELHLVEP